ncbi:hypothetical protein BJ742DRAFT_774616 [Cladochytrium replicatum]|nr:hypothetical protein BJ742DRAFT_774616 [Cladochytrium replicatum]
MPSYSVLPFEILRRIFEYVAAIDRRYNSTLTSNTAVDETVHHHLALMVANNSPIHIELGNYKAIQDADSPEARVALLESEDSSLALGDYNLYQENLLQLHRSREIYVDDEGRRKRRLVHPLSDDEMVSRDRVHAFAIDLIYDRLNDDFDETQLGGRWHYRILSNNERKFPALAEIVPRTINLETCASVCTTWRDVALSILLESQYLDDTFSLAIQTVPAVHRHISSKNSVRSLTYLTGKSSSDVVGAALPKLLPHFEALRELVWYSEEPVSDTQLMLFLCLVLERNVSTLDIRLHPVHSENNDAYVSRKLLFPGHPLTLNADDDEIRICRLGERERTIIIMDAFLTVVSPFLTTLKMSSSSLHGILLGGIQSSIEHHVPRNLTRLHLMSVPHHVVRRAVTLLLEAGIASNLLYLSLESHNVSAPEVYPENPWNGAWTPLQPPFAHPNTNSHAGGIPSLWNSLLPLCTNLEALSLSGTFVSTRELSLFGTQNLLLCSSLHSLNIQSTHACRWDNLDALHSAWGSVADRAVATLREWDVYDCCSHIVDVIADARSRIGKRRGLRVVRLHSWSWCCPFDQGAMRKLAECVPVVWYGRETKTLQTIIREFDEQETDKMDEESDDDLDPYYSDEGSDYREMLSDGEFSLRMSDSDSC